MLTYFKFQRSHSWRTLSKKEFPELFYFDPSHFGDQFLGCCEKKSQITSDAWKSLQVWPMVRTGRYCFAPGHVCPPPIILYNTTDMPVFLFVHSVRLAVDSSVLSRSGRVVTRPFPSIPLFWSQNSIVAFVEITLPLLGNFIILLNRGKRRGVISPPS